MAGPPTSSYSELSFHFTGNALVYPATCTLGMTVPTGPPQTALDDLASDANTLHGAMSVTNCQLVRMDLKIGPEASGPTFTTVPGGTGLQGSAAASAQVALLLRKTVTGVTNRRAGRMYWPGVDESLSGGNSTFSSGFINQVNDAWDVFLAACEAYDMTPVVFPADLSSPRAVDSIRLQSRPATQRRRLRR